jgi:hypothetical protein
VIPIPPGRRVWIATGYTDMRRGMQGLALQVQEQLKRDPHAGDLYVFRGRRGDLAKILGMTASDCRSTPSGLTEDGSFGRRRRRASCRSRRRRWPTCWKASTGAIRS